MRRNSDNSCWMRVISIGILLQILANCGKSQFFPTFNVNPFIIGRSSSRRVTRSATAIYSEHCSTRWNSFQFYLILRQVICVVTIFGLIQWYGLNAVRISSSGRIIILKLFVFFFFCSSLVTGERMNDNFGHTMRRPPQYYVMLMVTEYFRNCCTVGQGGSVNMKIIILQIMFILSMNVWRGETLHVIRAFSERTLYLVCFFLVRQVVVASVVPNSGGSNR